MKGPPLLNVKTLKIHLEATEGKLRVDTAFVAYLMERNIKKIPKLIHEGTILGFCSYLSPLTNRKLDEITEEKLEEAIKSICSIDSKIIYFVEALKSHERQLY